MSRIAWHRIIISGILTGLVWTLLSATLIAFFASDLYAAAPRLINPGPFLMVFSLSINLIMGVWAMWLFTCVRHRYGSRSGSVLATALGWWVIYSLSKANWGPYGMVSTKALAMVLVLALPALVISVMVGVRFQD
jgi:hypothetical protein